MPSRRGRDGDPYHKKPNRVYNVVWVLDRPWKLKRKVITSLPREVFLRAPGEIGPSEGLSDALLVHQHQGAELAIRVPGLQLAAHLAGQVFAEEASVLPDEPAVQHHGDALLRLVAQPGRERGRAVLDLLLALALVRPPVHVRVVHDVGEVDRRVLLLWS